MRKLLFILLFIFAISSAFAGIAETDINGDGLINCIDNALLVYDTLLHEYGISTMRFMYGYARYDRQKPPNNTVAHVWIELPHRIGWTNYIDATNYINFLQRAGYVTDDYWDPEWRTNRTMWVTFRGFASTMTYQYHQADVTVHVDRIRKGTYNWNNVYGGGW